MISAYTADWFHFVSFRFDMTLGGKSKVWNSQVALQKITNFDFFLTSSAVNVVPRPFTSHDFPGFKFESRTSTLAFSKL